MWIYFIWQEEWSTSLLSTKKFLKGKIVYQRDPEEPAFYVRQYEIKGEELRIGELEEGPFGPGVMPSDVVKQLDRECRMSS